ncbi:Glycosylphosphatidylinositol anchor attachment 1 protein [Nymphon striatum]|nr:Glycosylphosphatidylinositol anchor attachment 1 protein [Nymphon striatum]
MADFTPYASIPVNELKSYISDDEWFDSWKSSMNTLLLMVMKQASGRPSSGHGLFHRYAIQSLTIETNDRPSQKYSSISYNTVGRVIEGVFRSLNNLLEKFHQSFFFYLLPSIHRYISIGMYMPPFALIAIPILLKISFYSI